MKTKYWTKRKQLFTVILASLLVLGTLSLTGCIEDEEEEEGTLRIAFHQEPEDFHPIRYTSGYEVGQFLQQIFDPLVVSYYEGEMNFGSHAVGESMDMLDDGMRYRFEIQEGIKFHNGDDLTAKDVEFSINTMMMGPDEEDEYFDLYDVDENPTSVRAADYGPIDEVEAIDDYTLEIRMETVDVEFLLSDGFENLRIVPLDYIEENGWEKFDEELIGTGPYEFVEYVEGQRLVLEKADNRHVEVNDVEKIIVEYYDSESAMSTALRAGDVDMMADSSTQTFFDLQGVEGLVTDVYEGSGTDYIAFNHEDGPTTDVRVRKAIAWAIDVPPILEGANMEEFIEPMRALVPPGHPAYPDDLLQYEQDQDKARQLLADAGYEDGLELDFYATEGSDEPMVIIQEQLEEVGIDVNIITLEWGGFLSAQEAAEPDIMFTGWPGAASTKYMMGWLVSDHYDEQWSLYYDSEEYTETMFEAYETLDFDERQELYKEAQRIIVEDEMGLYVLGAESDRIIYQEHLIIPDKTMKAYGDGPLAHIHLWEIEE